MALARAGGKALARLPLVRPWATWLDEERRPRARRYAEMKTVGIVEYGMCNLDSVARAVEECGGRAVIMSEPSELAKASSFILPGVGAFAKGMQNLRERRLDVALEEQVAGHAIPILGICLGMQLLASRGTEGGETRGLGWIEGDVLRLEPSSAAERIPHIGWNELHIERPNPLLDASLEGRDFYFVHSFALRNARPEDAIATAPYCGGFTAAVARDHVYGVQFHPEKSQRLGFQVLRSFLAL
jgi:imidazole glycerol-phosphate synthase subunit HisH